MTAALKILAQFDDDAMAQKVYRLVKAGRIAELSFAFDTIKSALLDDPDRPDAFRELQELKLYEVSVVPIGANSETEVPGHQGRGRGDDPGGRGRQGWPDPVQGQRVQYPVPRWRDLGGQGRAGEGPPAGPRGTTR